MEDEAKEAKDKDKLDDCDQVKVEVKVEEDASESEPG